MFNDLVMTSAINIQDVLHTNVHGYQCSFTRVNKSNYRRNIFFLVWSLAFRNQHISCIPNVYVLLVQNIHTCSIQQRFPTVVKLRSVRLYTWNFILILYNFRCGIFKIPLKAFSAVFCAHPIAQVFRSLNTQVVLFLYL